MARRHEWGRIQYDADQTEVATLNGEQNNSMIVFSGRYDPKFQMDAPTPSSGYKTVTTVLI